MVQELEEPEAVARVLDQKPLEPVAVVVPHRAMLSQELELEEQEAVAVWVEIQTWQQE